MRIGTRDKEINNQVQSPYYFILLYLQRIFSDVLLSIDFMTLFFLEKKKREIIAKNSYHMKNIAKKNYSQVGNNLSS